MRILLVTHETSRTGAPRVAIMMAQGFHEQGHSVRVVARFPGPLLSEFQSEAPTTVEPFYRLRRRLHAIRAFRLVALVSDWAVVLAMMVRHRPDLVYVNSAAAAVYLRPARWFRRRVILHVHESARLVNEFLRRARSSKELSRVRLVACSPSVQGDLAILTGHGIADIPMIPSVPDDSRVMRLSAGEPDLAYQDGELIVGCCGAVEYRKGADLWPQIAARVNSQLMGLAVRFIWIGEDDPDVRPVGGSDVEFVGARANPYPHIRRFDIFALPSRDDPFPLVVIEAMLLGKPVVAFDVGGVSEQVGDTGVLVPVGEITDLADRIVELLCDERSRRLLGGRARDRALNTFSTRAFIAAIGDLVEAIPRDSDTRSGKFVPRVHESESR